MTDIYENGATTMNEDRANWAFDALKTREGVYADDYADMDRDHINEVVTDLITDLFHLLRAAGLGEDALDATVTAAYGHFQTEVQEEIDEDDEPDDPAATVVIITPDDPTPMPVRAQFELAA